MKNIPVKRQIKHIIMLRILSLLFFLTLATVLSAQDQSTGILKGTVKTDSGQPASKATLTITSLNRIIVVNEDGNYQLVLPAGSFKITCSMVGYTRQEATVSITNGATTLQHFTLKRSELTQLQEVEVKGISAKKTIETSGFAVNVIETKEAALRNLQTNELLDRSVGVRVRQSGGIGSEANYNLNGMSGRAVGIFIDGIEISTYGSSFNLNNIPPAMIERIEIYKGVLPAHLSGDFLGGGINVILKKGAVRNNFTAAVSYGSFNTQQADVSGMYRNQKNGFTTRASAFYTYSDNDYEVWSKWVQNEMPNGRLERTKAKRFNDAFKSYGGRVEAGFTDVKWADNFMLSYNGSDSYKEVQHGQYMTKPYMGRFTESQAYALGLNYSRKNIFTDGLDFTFNGVYSDRDQYIQDTVGWRYNWSGEKVIDLRGNPLRSREGAQQGRPTMNTIQRKIATFRTGLQYAITNNHQLVLNNVYYIVDRSDYDQARTVLEQKYLATSDLSTNITSLAYEMQAIGARLKTNLFGKYYQQKIDRLEPVVEVVNGQNVRVEKSYIDNRSTIGYGLATSFAVKSNLIILASAEKAVRMPGEGEIFGNQAENMLANVQIRPEISNNFNLGFRAGTFNLGDHKVALSASGFLRDTKDKIVMLTSDRSVTQVDVTNNTNLNGTQSIGFEAEINYIYKHLNVMVNTSRFKTLLKDKASLFNNYQLPNEPFHTINGNVQYRFNSILLKKSILNLYYNFGYVQSFETIFQLVYSDFNSIPPQFIQDAGFSFMFPNRKFLIAVDAKNIFNKEAFDNFAAQKPGRAFYIKLNYTINNF
jgi:outer membrane cobalamin receptor